ncbi:MAG: hypothetical protein JWM74_4450, partial [Myxococcaceae bacterium]|nr:hypothetical protein [Myxococcaceae bacterium]
MSRRTIATFAIGVGGALAACSLVTSVDGLTGGSAVDASLDSPIGDASQSDSSLDAPPPLVDAGTDAADADAGSWCARHPSQFCVDFDQPNNISARWDSIHYPFNDAAAATIALDGVTFVSGPSSAIVKLPKDPANNCRFAGLAHLVPGSAKEVHLAYDIRMTDATAHQGTLLDFAYPSWDCNYFIAHSNTGSTYLYEQSYDGTVGERSGSTHTFKTPLVPAVWSRVEINLVLDSAPTSVSVKLDGKQVVDP